MKSRIDKEVAWEIWLDGFTWYQSPDRWGKSARELFEEWWNQ